MDAPRLLDVFPEAADVAAVLAGRRLTVAVAESCTGGLLGAVLTAVPGSSAWFIGGVIAYSNDLKRLFLGVDARTLETAGAVSREVADQMAVGAARVCGATIGVSITGVAGPTLDDGGKPAGLTYISAARNDRLSARRVEGDTGREGNRVRAVRTALELILDAARI